MTPFDRFSQPTKDFVLGWLQLLQDGMAMGEPSGWPDELTNLTYIQPWIEEIRRLFDAGDEDAAFWGYHNLAEHCHVLVGITYDRFIETGLKKSRGARKVTARLNCLQSAMLKSLRSSRNWAKLAMAKWWPTVSKENSASAVGRLSA